MSVALAGVAAFAEAMLGIGIVLPGEATITALTAAAGHQLAPWLWLAVFLGACAGDQINYWLGRAWGPRLATSRLVRRLGSSRWDRGTALLQRHGARAVLLSRMVPVVRTLVPAAAGTAHVGLPSFTAASAIGCAIWAALWVGAGSVLGGLVQYSLRLLLVALGLAVSAALIRRATKRLC